MPSSRISCSGCSSLQHCCDCWFCRDCENYHLSSFRRCRECYKCSKTCTCIIKVWNFDPLLLLAFHGHPEDRIFLGIEIEVEAKEGEEDIKARTVLASDPSFFVIKHDGSLRNGFEIVTAPASLSVHKDKLRKLLQGKAVRGLSSWNTGTCGLHVHISRAPLSPLTIAKVVKFINSSRTRHNITSLAGRKTAHGLYRTQDYARLAVKDWYDVGKKYVKYNKDEYLCGRSFRYQAVNLTNEHTIEIRIFRGTLSYDHIMANLEFCDAVVRWAMNVSARETENWSSFWSFAKENSKRYSHFLAFMRKKHLVNCD